MSDDPPDDNGYAVGYGRPPTASRFKSGQSGNPRGRPKGSRSVGAILKDVMGRKISITENGKTRRVSALEGMMHRLRSEALGGDKAAFKILLLMFDRYAETGEGAVGLDDLLPEDLEILAQYEEEARNAVGKMTPGGASEPESLPEAQDEEAP